LISAAAAVINGRPAPFPEPRQALPLNRVTEAR
jgi:hypothetical protein